MHLMVLQCQCIYWCRSANASIYWCHSARVQNRLLAKILHQIVIKNGPSPASFSLFPSFQYTVDRKQMLTIKIFLLMTGFEPRTFGIGSNCSTNWATTTAYCIKWLLNHCRCVNCTMTNTDFLYWPLADFCFTKWKKPFCRWHHHNHLLSTRLILQRK